MISLSKSSESGVLRHNSFQIRTETRGMTYEIALICIVSIQKVWDMLLGLWICIGQPQ